MMPPFRAGLLVLGLSIMLMADPCAAAAAAPVHDDDARVLASGGKHICMHTPASGSTVPLCGHAAVSVSSATWLKGVYDKPINISSTNIIVLIAIFTNMLQSVYYDPPQ